MSAPYQNSTSNPRPAIFQRVKAQIVNAVTLAVSTYQSLRTLRFLHPTLSTRIYSIWADAGSILRISADVDEEGTATGPEIWPVEYGSESVTTNGSTATGLYLFAYNSKITSGGSAGPEDAELGATTFMPVGFRKLITFLTQTDPSDVIVLDHANMVNSAGVALTAATIDAEGGFILVENNGLKWQVIYSGDATLTT
jgi:hypothetical protein